MAIPVALTEARDKLQRTRQQGDRSAEGVQRKRYAPPAEVVDLRGKRYVRQQVTKSLQRVGNSEEREQEPQEFRQESHGWIILSGFVTRCSSEWIEGGGGKSKSRAKARH